MTSTFIILHEKWTWNNHNWQNRQSNCKQNCPVKNATRLPVIRLIWARMYCLFPMIKKQSKVTKNTFSLWESIKCLFSQFISFMYVFSVKQISKLLELFLVHHVCDNFLTWLCWFLLSFLFDVAVMVYLLSLFGCVTIAKDHCKCTLLKGDTFGFWFLLVRRSMVWVVGPLRTDFEAVMLWGCGKVMRAQRVEYRVKGRSTKSKGRVQCERVEYRVETIPLKP